MSGRPPLGWLSDEGWEEAFRNAIASGELVPVKEDRATCRFTRTDGRTMIAMSFMYREDWEAAERERLERRAAAMQDRVDRLRKDLSSLNASMEVPPLDD